MSPPRSGLRPFDPRLLRRTTDVRWVLGLDVAIALTATVLLLAQVTLLAGGVADVAGGGDLPVAAVAGLLTVVALRAVLVPFVEWSGRRAANQVMSGLRRELVATSLAPGRPVDVDAGELALAAVQGVDGLETYFARYLPQVALAVTVPVAVLGWTAWVDPASAAIMLVTLPVIPIFLILIGRSAARRSRANWQAMVELSTHFLDIVTGLPTLRAFNRGQAQGPKIAEATERYRRTTMGTLRLAFLSGVVLDLATSLSVALVAVTLGVRLVGGSVALGPALTVLLLVPELYAPIRAVGTLFHASADGLAGAERILALLEMHPTDTADAPPQGPNPPRELPDARRSRLVLEGVTVAHDGRAQPALDSIDVGIEAGELVVVTGPSGAGKTTLGRVLVGLDVPSIGRLLVGDQCLTRADADAWRRQVAFTPQRPSMVSATVAENIALGRPDATAEQVQAAAIAAGAHDFIVALPQGYATSLGAGGSGSVGLSTGERQRLGLARALLRDAPVMVLDEPTAHLDPVSVDVVQATLARCRGLSTIIVITHDERLLSLADRRIELQAGRLLALDGRS